MDLAVAALIAQTASSIVVPHLPKLLRSALGTDAAEAKGESSDGWGLAEALWMQIRPKFAERPDATRSVEEVATVPASVEANNHFSMQLRQLLVQDPGLAVDLTKTLRGETRALGSLQVGENNVVRGGSASGSFMGSGDATRAPVEGELTLLLR